MLHSSLSIRARDAFLIAAVFLIAFVVVFAVLVKLKPASSKGQEIPRPSPMGRITQPAIIPTILSGMVPTPSREPLAVSTATSTIPSEPSSSGIRLLVVGDIMLDRNVATRMKTARTLAYPFAKLPADWIASFDYSIANLEGPVTPVRRAPVKSIDFQFDPAVAPMLKAQGFDAFSLANNHGLDQGEQGYQDSTRILREAGIVSFGHQVRDGEIALATTTVKGTRIAFLGWNTTDNPMDRDEAARAITMAKSQADVVIAYLHWGAEYQDHPLSSVQEAAHWLIDEGVDVVLGGHPHWVQGIYSYKGHPILYSLGNFVFDQDWSLPTRQGLAVGLTINDRGFRIEPYPVNIDLSQPRLTQDKERAQRLEALAAISDPALRAAIRLGTVDFVLR